MPRPVESVRLESVTKRFDTVIAVDSVGLSIGEGEFFSLLGPSGCGKTTTLRMIAGLEFPTEGSIRIHGEEMGLRPPNKRPVNTVFQNYALFPHMSVAQNVSFGLEMRKVAKAERTQRVAQAIALVQLTGMENRKPAALSGGQQQRVALARALVNRPRVLLLDEPLGALDLKLRQEMQSELKALQQQVGLTFVYVTHDQEEALTMSDRIGVMNQGHLLQVGPPEEIYEQPLTRFVADFIGRTNLLDATVESAEIVCLANGDRLPAASGLPAGAKVSVSLRPERLAVRPRDSVSPDMLALEGEVDRVTYMGNAVVYGVKVGWMTIEVRQENEPGTVRHEVGDEVSVTWVPEAMSLVVA
ncbi:MAG: ABC transporter ATP-binding protein [Actinobacteria bacterium]|nr:MAG: ABC transporter ATP-binding protein [Actinomycetota bacterium]RIK04637.1 MAG: spermidine/putrescine ABC transporter ATP-binding protein [Acidobacteriota bacterium]